MQSEELKALLIEQCLVSLGDRAPCEKPAARSRASLRASAITTYEHYFASLLIADGADVKTIQARLRHASAKTTLDTYGDIWPDRDESTRAAVDTVLTAYLTEQRRNSTTAKP